MNKRTAFLASFLLTYLKQTQRYDYDAFDEAYYDLPVLQEKVTAYIKNHIHEF